MAKPTLTLLSEVNCTDSSSWTSLLGQCKAMDRYWKNGTYPWLTSWATETGKSSRYFFFLKINQAIQRSFNTTWNSSNWYFCQKNTTSELQSANAEIIGTFKSKYRKRLVRHASFLDDENIASAIIKSLFLIPSDESKPHGMKLTKVQIVAVSKSVAFCKWRGVPKRIKTM